MLLVTTINHSKMERNKKKNKKNEVQDYIILYSNSSTKIIKDIYVAQCTN